MNLLQRTLPTVSTALHWLAAALVIGLFAAPSALAQMPGTMYGQVFDENQNPVPGVTLTLKDPERPDFVQTVTTDKRGRFRIRIANATVPYRLSLSKEGYQTLNLGGVKIPARKETRRNFELMSAQAALAAGSAPVDAEAAQKGAAIEVYNQGVAALRASDLDTAESLFKSALEKQPDLGAAYAALGRVYLEKKKYPEAIEAANKALELGVEGGSMHQVLYASYTELGDEEKAKEALAKLEEADPEKASKNLFNIAVDQYNNGDMANAKAGFEKVLSADPDNAKAHYLMGLIMINEGNNAAAKEHLEKFLALAPDDADAATAKEMIQYLSQ